MYPYRGTLRSVGMSSAAFLELPARYRFGSEVSINYLGRTAVLFDTHGNCPVVCKRVSKKRLKDQANVQRFLERVDHIRSLNSPYIVSYSDVIETADHIFLIRPYIEAPSLVEYVEKDKNTAMIMWKVVAKTVLDLHKHHIAPNFLKPSNIFFVKNRTIVLTDLYPRPLDLDVMVHSPHPFEMGFLAPEHFSRNGFPGAPSDIWSLGVLLVFMMTEKLPWNWKNVFTMIQEIQAGKPCIADLPPEAEDIVTKALVMEPSKRLSLTEIVGTTPVPRFGSDSEVKKVRVVPVEGSHVEERPNSGNKKFSMQTGCIMSRCVVMQSSCTDSKMLVLNEPEKRISNTKSEMSFGYKEQGFPIRKRYIDVGMANKPVLVRPHVSKSVLM